MVSMTVDGLLREVTAQLEQAGCDAPAFDARCLLEDIGGVGRGRVDIRSEAPLPAEAVQAVRRAAFRRAGGYPLQYLLGEWDFLTLTLRVGEGVLIPRPDTEVLCEEAANWLKRQEIQAPRALDLCAGSGCIGLGLCSLVPAARVTAVELSDAALPYLRENIARYPDFAVEAVQADVLRDAERFGEGYDLILSNPPYIPAAELPGLMAEVQHEPRMALDGGDGLVFYRVLARDWAGKLKPGGALMAEVGIGQADTVEALWRGAGLSGVHTVPDMNGVARVVAGMRK